MDSPPTKKITIPNINSWRGGGGMGGSDLTHMTAFWVREEGTNSGTGGVWHGTRMGRGGGRGGKRGEGEGIHLC